MSNQPGNQELDHALTQLLKEYEEKLKLGKSSCPISTFEQYSNLPKDVLDKMTPESCDEAALELLQYAIFIQREINCHKTRVNWCESYINSACAKEWSNYDKYMPKEVRIAAIAKENPTLRRVLSLREKASAVVTSLDHISILVNKYSDYFTNYSRSKRWTCQS